MNNRLSVFEDEMLEVLFQVRDEFAAGKVKKHRYVAVMAAVRDMIVKLENRQYGCATGKHAMSCSCKWV